MLSEQWPSREELQQSSTGVLFRERDSHNRCRRRRSHACSHIGNPTPKHAHTHTHTLVQYGLVHGRRVQRTVQIYVVISTASTTTTTTVTATHWAVCVFCVHGRCAPRQTIAKLVRFLVRGGLTAVAGTEARKPRDAFTFDVYAESLVPE